MKPKIGLALGSGSARGWAHIGVIRALEDAGIAYLSIMGGTYESFFLPEVMERMRRPGFLVDIAGEMP